MSVQDKEQFEKIADGIAESGYAVIDHFLNAEQVASVLQLDEFSEGLLRFRKAGIGKEADKQINESIRGDYIKWIDPLSAPEPVRNYLDKLTALRIFIRESLFLSLRDQEVHMTIYPAGTYYKRHLDQFKADDHRKLSVICYLNENWEEHHGGRLRMHLSSGPVDILPHAGRLVCFRSDLIEHEVLPSTRSRLSLTGWLLDREVDVKHL